MSESDPPEGQTNRSLGNSMRRLLRIVIIAYGLVVVLLGFFQRRLLYHPRKADNLAVARFADATRLFPAASDVEIRCEDDATIRGWLLQKEAIKPTVEEVTRPLVIFYHGNAGNRAGRIGWYHVFANCGADVLAIDYHGYGDSEGTMTESALEMDCEATWKYATETAGYKPADIIVVGGSLGGAAAVFTAAGHTKAEETPAGLMVVATFSSMVDVAGSLYPWLPVRAVLVDRYPSDERISSVTCPVVVLHGDQDSLVDQKLGRKLFDAAAQESTTGTAKKWVSMSGVNHNNLVEDGYRFVVASVTELVENWQKSSSP